MYIFIRIRARTGKILELNSTSLGGAFLSAYIIDRSSRASCCCYCLKELRTLGLRPNRDSFFFKIIFGPVIFEKDLLRLVLK